MLHNNTGESKKQVVFARRGEAARKRRNRSAHVLHKFHGTAEADGRLDYERIVFTRRQYETHYRADAPLVAALQAFYHQKPLLFLGCSLQKDRTLDVLRQVLRPGVVNYAFLPCRAEEIDGRISFLGALGIRAIFYPEGRHEAVRVLLEQVLAETDPEAYRQLPAHLGASAMKTREQLFQDRFHYNVGLYDPVEREELNELLAFLDDEADFRWWALVGPGGTGKSRLALTLTERLPDGWQARFLSRQDYAQPNRSACRPRGGTCSISRTMCRPIPNPSARGFTACPTRPTTASCAF